MLIKMNCRTRLSCPHHLLGGDRGEDIHLLDTYCKVSLLVFLWSHRLCCWKDAKSVFLPWLNQVLVCVTTKTLFWLNCGHLTVTQVTSARKRTDDNQPHPPRGHSLIAPSKSRPSPATHCFLRSFTLRHANFSASLFWPAVCKDYPAPRVSFHWGQFQWKEVWGK